MIDRGLYLPAAWTDDPERCAQAGVPEDIEFLTKPALPLGAHSRPGRRCHGPVGGR